MGISGVALSARGGVAVCGGVNRSSGEGPRMGVAGGCGVMSRARGTSAAVVVVVAAVAVESEDVCKSDKTF